MNSDTPAAFRHFLQDDLYLLPEDREFYNNRPEPATDSETPEIEFKYLGGYKKQFLITSYYAEHEHLEPAHLKALESTLQRISLSLDDVAILNLARHTAHGYEVLIAHLQPQKIVMLGKEALPVEVPVISLNQPRQIENVMLLYTHSFGEMMGNKENTKAFWNQIKQF